ncbi:MAG: hypothetical protein WEB58_08465 [Planctomycetaceae bacterium]
MSDRWYWKRKGDLVGPLTTAEVHDHIRKHRVRDGDSFQLEETEQWLLAAEIIALFQAEEASSAARSAADVLAANTHRLILGTGGDGRSRGSLTQVFARIAGGVGDVFSSIREAILSFIFRGDGTRKVSSGPRRAFRFTGGVSTIAERFGDAFDSIQGMFSSFMEWSAAAIFRSVRHVPQLWAKVTLAVLVAVLLFTFFKNLRFDHSVNKDTYAKLAATWSNYEAMESRSATEAEHAAFAEQTLAWLTPHVDDLEKRAREMPTNRAYFWSSDIATAHARRELLFAARSMRDDLTHGHGSIDGRALEQHMQKAHEFMTGNVKHFVSPYGPKQPTPMKLAKPGSFDGKTRAFIIFDGCVVVGLLSYWLWRRNNAFS